MTLLSRELPFVEYKQEYPPPNWCFAGWEFNVTPLYQPQSIRYRVGHVMLHARLHNPEGPGLDSSCHNYTEGGLWTVECAAAWLIAHWWEHYMHSCDCLVDDGKPSHFRWWFIETLLDLEGLRPAREINSWVRDS